MPRTRIGDHAVVIGASVGGLAAAAAVAPFFGHVTVIERDALPADTVPRSGVPQGRHVHVLLAGGLQALETLLPDFGEALAASGAIPLVMSRDMRLEYPGYDPFPFRDFGIPTYSMTRPLLEGVLRGKVRAIANVTLRDRTRVRALRAAPDGRVTGVRVDGPEGDAAELDSDLVIDASGRAAPTLDLLDRLGRPRPEVTEIGVDIGYATAMFAMPDSARAETPVVVTHPVAPASSRAGLLVPVENNRWVVTLAGMQDEKPPGDLAGFLAFAAGLRTPTIHERIRGCAPLGEVVRFGFPASMRRHFERLAELPPGLLPFGDSLCRFNPLYGQGMSARAQEAALLRRLLRSRTEAEAPLDRLAPDFLAAAQPLNDAAWFATVPVDLIYPHVTGERPADHAQQLQFGAAVRRLAAREADMHRLLTEVLHMLKPRAAFFEPGVLARIKAEMAAAAA